MSKLRKLWSELCNVGRGLSERRVHRKLRMAIKRVGFPWEEHPSGVFSVFAGGTYGYGTRVDCFVRDGGVHCMARVRVAYHRPWLPRTLTITLLEENSNYLVGSNQLVETEEGLALVQRHICDARRTGSREISEVCQTLIRQTKQLLVRLYAEDVILPAEELPLLQ